MSFCLRLENWLVQMEKALAGLSILAILLLSLAEIVARNVFQQGVPGADTAIRHLVLWVAFFGAVLAVSSDRHVKIDVAVAWLPKPFLGKLARPFSTFAAAVCATLAFGGYAFWHEEWSVAPPDEKWIAAMLVILPLGFALLALHFVLRALIGAHGAESHA